MWNAVRDAIFLADIETGIIVDANPAAEALCGRKLTELRSLHHTQLYPPEATRAARREFAKNARVPAVTEGTVVHKKGRRIPVEIATSHFTAPNGRRMLIGIFRDITERNAARERLRRSEERFLQVAESAGEFIWEVDDAGLYTYASPAIQQVLGYTPAEVVGRKHFYDLFVPETREELTRAALDVFHRRQPFRAFVNWNVTKDGKVVALETSGLPILDANGNLAGYRGADTDITDRKRAEAELARYRERLEDLVRQRTGELEAANAQLRDQIAQREQTEEALRRNEAFLRSITDLIPSRIAYLDRDQRYCFVNARYEEWFRRRRESIIGRHVKEVLDAAHYERARPYIEAVLSGRPVQYELDVKPDGGPRRELSVVYVPHLGDRGEILGFFASTDDITERRQLEEQVRQSQKMEAVGALAGGIAHDFNNLLTVINGYSEYALTRLGPGHPVSQNLQDILHAGERAASLTRQLLAFSRRQMLQPKVLDLNDLVESFESMLRRLIEADIDLKLDLDPDLARVKADPAQMQQVLLNLVVNARDAMPDGGELNIKTRNARFNEANSSAPGESQNAEYVLLAVSDTGHGMDAETQRRIFEPFFTTKGVGSTGLGLSTTYGIVKQSGGHISVSSEPGRGTTFEIYLPRCAELGEAIQPANLGPQPLAGRKTVLLVEDEPALRQMVSHALSECGYAVLEAADGEGAVEASEHHPETIDLLLTDVVMPRLGGRELAQRLMHQRPGMRVLYISGYDEAVIASRNRCDQADFLQKPFRIGDLVQRVGTLLATPGQAPE